MVHMFFFSSNRESAEDMVVRGADVVFATLHGAGSSRVSSLQGGYFDLTIIDECAQVMIFCLDSTGIKGNI